MNIDELKQQINKLIDNWANPPVTEGVATVTFSTPESTSEPKKELPKNKRAVRTPGQGDKVFVLDEETKKRHWAHNPEALATEGFDMEDVVEIPDAELIKYQIGAAIYKPIG